MGKEITAIEIQKKDRKRVSIYLDGEFGFGLSGILATWLKTGQELSDEKIEELIEEDQLEKAYQKALHFISYRPRSILEVVNNLNGKEISSVIIDKVIEKLQNNNILDDKVFAKVWIENRNDFHPRSRFALRMELKKKGIPEEIIENELQSVDEEKLAYKAGRKYSNRLKKLELPLFRKKLSSFLARKGFAYSIIYPVVEKLWNEIQEESNQGELNYNKENSWTQ
ncbi:RecX family transcriptional regulator [Chloroflexota bacterium]